MFRIHRHIFGKVFLVYMCITLLTTGILIATLSHSLMKIKTEETMTMSDQILETLGNYMDEKCLHARAAHQRLYSSTDIWNSVTKVIQGQSTTDYLMGQFGSDRNSLFQTIHAVDSQFYNAYFLNLSGDAVLRLGQIQENPHEGFLENMAERTAASDRTTPLLFADRASNNHSNAFPIFVCTVVNDPKDFSKQIGTMAVAFSVRNIPHIYERFMPYLKGSLYIVGQDGSLLYDSTETYPEDFELPEQIVSGEKVFTVSETIYKVRTGTNCIIINCIPRSLIREDIRVLQKDIFGVCLLILLVALTVSVLSIRRFSKRLQAVTGMVEEIGQGKLSGFADPAGPEDEIMTLERGLIGMSNRLKDHIDREYIYRLRQKEMELYTLQAQVNPHFLYNTLESIRMYLYMRGEETGSRMIQILSELFRGQIKNDHVVTLRDELRTLESYLELHKFRMGDRLKYEIRVSPELGRLAVLKFILQPIVENAIVHGITAKEGQENFLITVSAEKEGDDLILSVCDDGAGISAEELSMIQEKLKSDPFFQKSIGIYNVNSRVQIVYGPSYGLTLQSTLGQGTCVTVRIKAMRKKELEDYVSTAGRG